MDVYKLIEHRLRLSGLSVAEAAKICDLPDSTLRGIITRKQKSIALDVAFKIHFGLDISLEELNGMQKKVSTVVEAEDNRERQLLIDNFDAMNIAGQEELLKHSKLLLNDPQYRACAQFDSGKETA